MKNKLKTTSFWLGISGAIVLLLDTITEIFGFSIPSSNIENIITSIAIVLVAVGFITKKTESGKEEKTDVLIDEIIKNDDENIGEL